MKPIETTVAKWANKVAKGLAKGNVTMTPEELRKSINRQLEALQRLQTVASQVNREEGIDPMHLEVLNAWAREHKTPASYKHHYRVNK